MAASKPADPRARERGFALLIVLWTMALLAMLGTQVTATGRADTRTAQALRTGAALEAAADAAMYETIYHLMNGNGDQWTPGANYALREAGFPVAVTVIDDRGKLDLNQTPPVLMEALLDVLGVESGQAHTLANAISEWRTATPTGAADPASTSTYKADGLRWGPPGQDFQSLQELQLVDGMTPAIYQAMLPYVTLALEQGPWLSVTGSVVNAALAKAKQASGLAMDDADPRGPVVMQIVAEVRGPGEARFTRRVLMRLDGTLNGAPWKYRILAWGSGA